MQVSLLIKSAIDEIPLVYEWLKDIIQPLTTVSQSEKILLITQEIVTNSIIHGNLEDPDKSVNLDLQVNDKSFIIHIQDEGAGIGELPTPEEADNMSYLDEGGRGLKLAVKLCDEVQIVGSKIELVFHRHKT